MGHNFSEKCLPVIDFGYNITSSYYLLPVTPKLLKINFCNEKVWHMYIKHKTHEYSAQMPTSTK